MSQDCGLARERAVEQDLDLIEATAVACLAAQTGDSELWGEAENLRGSLELSELNCLEVPLFNLLEDLLDKHAAQPGRAFEFGTSAGPAPCPTVTGIDPDHGPEGTCITVQATNPEYVTGVRVVFADGGEDVAAGGDPSCGPGQYLMPEIPGEATSPEATVIVVSEPQEWPRGEARFTYEGGSTPSGGEASTGPGPSDPPDSLQPVDPSDGPDPTGEVDATGAPSSGG